MLLLLCTDSKGYNKLLEHKKRKQRHGIILYDIIDNGWFHGKRGATREGVLLGRGLPPSGFMTVSFTVEVLQQDVCRGEGPPEPDQSGILW